MTFSNRFLTHKGMLRRPRINERIKAGLQSPFLILLAGPGYGKTQALTDYLSECDASVLWIRLNRLDNLPVHFWNHLTGVIRSEYEDLADDLQKLGFPETLACFHDFTEQVKASAMSRHKMVWVFDDFGEIKDRQIRTFFELLARTELENHCFVVVSNDLSGPESVAFIASRQSLLLTGDLKFTSDEIADLYGMYGFSLKPEEVTRIETYTEGWPLSLHLLVMQHDPAAGVVTPEGAVNDHTISCMFEERFYTGYEENCRKLLIRLSLLQSFSITLAKDLYEGDHFQPEMFWSHSFISNEPAMGHFYFHNLYRVFLRTKKYLLTAGEERQLWQKAASYYRSEGDTLEAIACYRKCGDHENMVNAIVESAVSQFGITDKSAAFFLEHLDILTPEEVAANPMADSIRALIYLIICQLDKAERLIGDLEQRLLKDDTKKRQELLGEVYAIHALTRMMRGREDFGRYFGMAAELLPDGANFSRRTDIKVYDNHSFFMADNRPGAKERMEQAFHAAAPMMVRVMNGCMSGVEYIFSAEMAYLSGHLKNAEQFAYRGIYKAGAGKQHDLVCNGYCLLARIAYLSGDFEEMTGHIDQIKEYAVRHEIPALKEIRDTALGWYYIKVRDIKRVPEGIVTISSTERSQMSYGRSQMVYANYLIATEEYARLVGMLEYLKDVYLFLTISQDRICLYIMLAIGYLHLDKREEALKAFRDVYDMSYHNGLITPFIEANDFMAELISLARSQEMYYFEPDWLDRIEYKCTDFARQAHHIRAVYHKQNPVHTSADSPLSKRECQVLQALSRGMTREEISAEYYISVNTVKSVIRSIYNKLDTSNRAEAVSIAIARGYIDGYAAQDDYRGEQ